MVSQAMDILVTIDEHYLSPLKVMLLSLKEHNKNNQVTIWLIHERIEQEKLLEIEELLSSWDWTLKNIRVKEQFFDEAPTVKRYPKEMYYRLLCGEILPKKLKRILYLDPDILIINSLDELWDLDLEGYLLGAARHSGVTNLTTSINNIRLKTDHNYYNSGVMLIDLEKARELIKLEDINQTIEKFANVLLLPDQDILNHLYGQFIKEIPEEKWNYDARKYKSYLVKSLGEYDIHWMMKNTSVLHFCGKPKPWEEKSETRFTALYLDYAKRISHH